MKNHTKPMRTISLFLASIFLFASCASTTMIQSIPEGAKLYLDGQPVGTTPYEHRDTKIVGSVTTVRLENEGYATINTNFSRNEEADVGAIVGGIFVLIPFLWVMKYKPVHSYEMIPLTDGVRPVTTEKPQHNQPKTNAPSKSKADRLRELKELLDEEIITQEEFELEKKKILSEDDY